MNNFFNCSQKLIWIRDLSTDLDMSVLDKEFYTLPFKDNVANKISVEMNLLDQDKFKHHNQVCTDIATQYLSQAYNLKDFFTKLKITNSWANYTEPSHGHHEHTHPFSIVSGVIFLDNNPTNGNLYIESYLPDIPYFVGYNKTFISLNALLGDYGVNLQEHNYLQNHLVLFLSNWTHFVEKTNNDSLPRRTLSFNTFWEGEVGHKNVSLGSYTF